MTGEGGGVSCTFPRSFRSSAYILDFSTNLTGVTLDDSYVERIHYSERYQDDAYEFRHVSFSCSFSSASTASGKGWEYGH